VLLVLHPHREESAAEAEAASDVATWQEEHDLPVLGVLNAVDLRQVRHSLPLAQELGRLRERLWSDLGVRVDDLVGVSARDALVALRALSHTGGEAGDLAEELDAAVRRVDTEGGGGTTRNLLRRSGILDLRRVLDGFCRRRLAPEWARELVRALSEVPTEGAG